MAAFSGPVSTSVPVSTPVPESPSVPESIPVLVSTPVGLHSASSFMEKLSISDSYTQLVQNVFTSDFFSSAQEMDKEALELKSKEIKPLTFYLDLDETLFSAQLLENGSSSLSLSLSEAPIDFQSEYGLGDSDGEVEDLELASSVAKEGSVFRQVPMRTDIQIDPSGEAKPVQQKAHSVTIIARKRYLSIFRKIDTINEASRKLYGKDIIIVNILTNATYEQKEIHAIFSAAFPGCETIKKGVFYNNKRKQDPNKPSYPLPKHLQMQEDFDNVFEKIGALKVLTFLLDDSRTNCLGATKQGFQFLHFPINPMGRRPLQSYTNGEGKLFFEGIETLIHELAKHHEIDISS